MRKRAAIELSMKTFVIAAIGIAVIVLGVILLSRFLEITPKDKDVDLLTPGFENVIVIPEEARAGSLVVIRFYSDNPDYLVRAEMIDNQENKVEELRLYDSGSNADISSKDNIYGNVLNTKAYEPGVYSININVDSPEGTRTYRDAGEFQIYEENCISVINYGDEIDKIDVVFISQGYEDMTEFRRDVLSYINQGLFSYSPFQEHKSRFNFYIVNQSSDLDCHTNCKGIKNMICCNNNKVVDIASQCPSDQIIVLLKEDQYCGTASFYAKTCSYTMNNLNKQILVHEFGHSFGGLGDEYDYGESYPSLSLSKMLFPNCDTSGCSKWDGGCFEGCGWSDLYRSTEENCIMYGYTDVFCPVCQSHILGLLNNYREEGREEISERLMPNIEKAYLLNLNQKDNLNLNNIYVAPGFAPDRKIVRKEDYNGKIISFDNRVLYEFSFEMPDVEFPMPGIDGENPKIILLDEINHSVVMPYFDNGKQVKIYKDNQEVLNIDVGYFSDMCGDNKCQSHENNFECPQDCELMMSDEYCGYYKDGICDVDCKDKDPDCRKTWPIIIISIIVVVLAVSVVFVIRKRRV